MAIIRIISIKSTLTYLFLLSCPLLRYSAPDAVLQLDWIHGYRASDCRNNVRYTSDGCMVYHAARVGIVYDPLQHKQKFMTEHTEEIVSLAIDAVCITYRVQEAQKNKL